MTDLEIIRAMFTQSNVDYSETEFDETSELTVDDFSTTATVEFTFNKQGKLTHVNPYSLG